MNSAASLPCVTRTMPIIERSSMCVAGCAYARLRRQFCARRVDRAGDVAMRDGHHLPFGPKPASELLGSIDGAVTPAGTADRDGEIGFALAVVARQERPQQTGERGEEPLIARIGRDAGAD